MAYAAEGFPALFNRSALFSTNGEQWGLWSRINHHLVMEVGELEGKEASPTAGVKTAGASVKTTESGGIRVYHAGKKIKGRKRHILVDTLGLMVGLMVRSADIQDRDGAPTT